MPVRVFVSYTHDSEEHRAAVLRLAERLRADGVDAHLDRWVPGTPGQGWPAWMEDELEVADFVLIVCSARYYDRYRGKGDPATGRGGRWESNLVRDQIYADRSRLTRYVPILAPGADERQIPDPLRYSVTHYALSDGYDELFRLLTSQHEWPLPPLGPVRPMTVTGSSDDSSRGHADVNPFPFVAMPRVRDPSAHYPALVEEVRGALDQREIVLAVGPIGVGKTTLSQLVAADLGPAFVADLSEVADLVDAGHLERALQGLAKRARLLVLDNVHVLPTLARAAIDAWKIQSPRPRVLLLSRPDQTGRPPLDVPEAMLVSVAPDDGAFKAVAARVSKRVLGRPLPATILDQRSPGWRKTFAGNLAVFEAATRGALCSAMPTRDNRWDIDISEALFFIEEQLKEATTGEREAIEELAALGDLEVNAPLYLFRRRELAPALEGGFAYEREHDFRIVHPGYAALILMGDEDGRTLRLARLRSVVRRAPELGVVVAGRLTQRGEKAAARDICTIGLSDARAIERQLTISLATFEATLDLARRFRVTDAVDLDASMRGVDTQIFERACDEASPHLVLRLAAKIERSGLLAAPALRTAVLSLEREGPVRRAAARAARHGDIGLLAHHIQKSGLRHTPWLVATGLTRPNASAVVEGLGRSSANQTLLLLRSVRKAGGSEPRMQKIEQGLVEALCEPEAITTLRAWCIGDAATAAKLICQLPGPPVQALLRALSDDELRTVVAALAHGRRRDALDRLIAGIERSAPKRMPTVLMAVPPEHEAPDITPASLREYLESHGPLAWSNHAISHPTDEWIDSDLKTVTSALTYATEVTPDESLHLLTGVIGPDRFDRWLAVASPRRRAHHLLHLWATQPTSVLAWIARRKLFSRLPRAQYPAGPSTLSMLGAGALLGASLPKYRVTENTLHEALTRTMPAGHSGASTILVVSGILATDSDALLERRQDQWGLALPPRNEIFRRTRRYAALAELVREWHATQIPARPERLEALAAIAAIEPDA